jgi:hypothetical protein
MSNRNLAHAVPQIFSARLSSSQPLAARIVDCIRSGFRRFAAWRKLQRERKALYEFLASDHRAAADIGYRHVRE